jgi:hypothetical protein
LKTVEYRHLLHDVSDDLMQRAFNESAVVQSKPPHTVESVEDLRPVILAQRY